MSIQSDRYRRVQEHVGRYFRAVYGPDYVYRAPETFPSKFEQWMLAITRGTDEADKFAEKLMTEIETKIKESREHSLNEEEARNKDRKGSGS